MKKFNIIIVLLIPLICSGQDFQREVDTIPVEQEDRLLFAPWTGGTGSLNPYFVDIDGDDDYDLFCGNAVGRITFFENIGDPSVPEFNFITDFFDSIEIRPDSYGHSDISFCDIDYDNDQDMFISGIFTNYYGRILFYRNIGDENIYEFQLEDTLFGNVYYSNYFQIDFCDIDDDDDYDLFIGPIPNQLIGRICFYQNIGTPFEPNMQLETEYFENIDVGELAHPSFADIDDDGDFDLFIGSGHGADSDSSNGRIYYYENIGTPEVYDFDLVSSFYDSIYVGNEASPDLVDIDGDGDMDIFVGRGGQPPGSAAIGNMGGDLFYYQNNGDQNNPDFFYITKNYLNIDIGETSKPSFCDIDADGDLDLFIAHTYNHIVFYRNIGNGTNPHFILESEQYQGIEFYYGVNIDFADIDADCDYDMIGCSGTYGESFTSLFINQGTPDSAFFELYNPNLVGFIDFADPCFLDIDNDSDYDLFFGYLYDNPLDGRIMFFENQGDSARPNFVFITDYYFGIDAEYQLQIDFTDFDNDGDYDLFYSTYVPYSSIFYGWERIFYLENIGTPYIANFVLADSFFLGIETTVGSPEFADIDNDGDMDFFFGEADGGVNFYRNQSNPSPPVLSVSLSYPDVILHWHPIAGADYYQIFTDTIPYFLPTGLPAFTIFPPDTSITDSSAVNYGKRFYRVVAGN